MTRYCVFVLLLLPVTIGLSQAQQPTGPLPLPRPIADGQGARPLPRPIADDGDDGEGGDEISPRLKFSNATLDIVLADYAEKTGRTILQGPDLPKVLITLRSQDELTLDEYLQAIESVLAMYGIALLREGDKFLKVVPNAKARQEAMKIATVSADDPLEAEETDRLVSKMIPLKHIDLSEAQKAIEYLKHSYGQVQLFERINSILVTDTVANVNRFLQIIGYIDQPVEAREEPNIVQILHAKASEIKSKLEEIISDQQEEQKKSTVPKARDSGPPGVVRPAVVPGVIRARPTAEPVARINEIIEMAERGIIRGKVKIVADDRTNILIIITRPENMNFFEKIIKVLDVETAPDVAVLIIRLEYAKAMEVEATLNSLIGGKSKASESAAVTRPKGGAEAGESSALKEYVSRSQTPGEETAKSKIGELSATNIKILADERTNALLIMASKSDLVTLEEIVKSMDIMLSQVMIESVIVQVALDDSVSSGVQWVQRSMIAYENRADGGRKAVGAYAGTFGGGSDAIRDATTLNSINSAGGGLTAYFTHFGLNMDAIVTMVQSDARTQIMTAPIIVTTDNTEATITASQQKYFLKGSTVDQFGNVRPETEIKDIGLDLTVTPHINEQRNVMMEIEQNISDEGAPQEISTLGTFPTTVTRSFKAFITVQDGETIILGGLVRNSAITSKAGVPLLSRIPLLGWLFRSSSDRDERGEVVVFLTPYVLDTPQDIEAESKRRKESLNIEGLWIKGWSGSKLADDADLRWSAGRSRSVRGVKPESDAEEDPAMDGGSDSDADVDPALLEFMRLQEGRMEEGATKIEQLE